MQEHAGYPYQWTQQGQPIQRRQSLPTEQRTRLPSQPTASRHRAGHSSGFHPEDAPYMTAQKIRKQPISTEDDEEADIYTQRNPTSTIRHRPIHPDRQLTTYQKPKQEQRQRRFHWLFFVGLALLIMILGWVALSALSAWWQHFQDDLHYGHPRTFQVDQVVGHDDSPTSPSHFIALNLHGQIEVIEQEGGNPAKSQVFRVMTLSQNQEDDPVTVTFTDVNHNGKPDMLVSFASFTIVFVNTGTTFQASHS
jgi:hypothetical protein